MTLRHNERLRLEGFVHGVQVALGETSRRSGLPQTPRASSKERLSDKLVRAVRSSLSSVPPSPRSPSRSAQLTDQTGELPTSEKSAVSEASRGSCALDVQRRWLAQQQQQQQHGASAGSPSLPPTPIPSTPWTTASSPPRWHLRRMLPAMRPRPPPTLLRSVSHGAHGVWLMLRPDQLGSEDGEVGFFHPIIGGAATTARLTASLEVPEGAAAGDGAAQLSYVPVTDVRTADVNTCAWLAEVIGCGGAQGTHGQVLVRYEFSSLPPGVQV